MICASKLPSSFKVSNKIFSQVSTLDTDTSNVNVGNTELRFGSSRRDPFFYLFWPPLCGSLPMLWEPLLYCHEVRYQNGRK